ncbi:BstXI family restriction endonuclease [Acinetobacter baumannii]|uniref:BstXI family restriction endonuclease n=1 Tax=Acinetobacter baumannii TaxID=470 RepID=UPI0034CDB644
MKQPKIPSLLNRKIYKTGQTRGADDDVIYQNRVLRNSTVLIPFEIIKNEENSWILNKEYENGFIVLITPEQLFGEEKNNTTRVMNNNNLSIGKNSLVFYTQRNQYIKYPPELMGLRTTEPTSRCGDDLGGDFVARISATTSEGKIQSGYNTTNLKGAGIRLFEYSDNDNIKICRIQLESIYWMCADSISAAIDNGMSEEEAVNRKKYIFKLAKDHGLIKLEKLKEKRIIDHDNHSICPLCLMKLSAKGFYTRVEQQEFRTVHDLTITEINLFHIHELRYGEFNHKPYNLGWGHHHCNVVTKDSGISETINWMKEIIARNKTHEEELS